MIGTSWHGVFEHDAFRRALLCWVAEVSGRRFTPSRLSFSDARQRQLDVLGDLVARHLDPDRLMSLIDGGLPPDLPVIAARRDDLAQEVQRC